MAEITGGIQIPVSDTIFSGYSLLICVILLISLPIINVMMSPKAEDVVEADPALFVEDDKVIEVKPRSEMSPAEKIENSMIVSLLLGILGVAYIIYYFVSGGSLGLNSVNLIFLFLGILLHKTPANYLRVMNEAIKNTGGIVLQFPLYAGIMGMMVGSGLAASISEWFVQVSTVTTFPFFTFLSAGIVNFFVPSGGGQWGGSGSDCHACRTGFRGAFRKSSYGYCLGGCMD